MRQVINIGTSANDGTGDRLRTAFDKINNNFTELYAGGNSYFYDTVENYGVVGSGIETEAIQTMFNSLSGKVRLVWGNKTYRFFGVTVPAEVTDLEMVFENTIWAYPLKASPDYYYRYKNAAGYANSQLNILGASRISFRGTLTFDGEARLGNTFNISGQGSVYSGEGLAPLIKIAGISVTEFTDTWVKSEGSFTIKDHGFAGIGVHCSTTAKSFNEINLQGWTWDDTPIGGHQLIGFFNKVHLHDYNLIDNYAKTFLSDNYAEEGARGFEIRGYNSSDIDSYINYAVVENIFSKRTFSISMNTVKNQLFKNIYVDGFGTYIGGDGAVRNLSEDTDSEYDIITMGGGHIFKVDPVWYWPENKLIIDNLNCLNTSLLMSGASRAWRNFWAQSSFKNLIVKNSRIDSQFEMGGYPVDEVSESWSFRMSLTDSEITEDGFITTNYGVKIINCLFSRKIPTKAADGSPDAASKVDYPFPVYSDLKLCAYLHSGTQAINETLLGAGDKFAPAIFRDCTFIARYFYVTSVNSNTKFIDCIFEEGSTIYGNGNVNNYNFIFELIRCKRVVIANYGGEINADKKATTKVFLQDSEIIITGYAGTSDLDNANSTIRILFDGTNYEWDNLKIYDASGNLLHNLKDFTWLREPSGVNDYGILGATYETASNKYYHNGANWVIEAK